MFLYIVTFWVLIPLLVGLKVFRRQPFLTITWFLLLASLIFSIANLVVPLFWWTNYPVLHGYTLVEFVLLALLYRELLRSRVLKRIVYSVIILFLAYKVADMIWITTVQQVDYVAVNVESAIVFILTLLYFGQLFREKPVRRITSLPAFWINNANLFYFAGILVFSTSYLYGHREDVLWSRFYVHDYLLFLRNLLLTLAFWLAYRQYRSSRASLVSDN